MSVFNDIYDSPIGKMLIQATDRGISHCDFIEEDSIPEVTIPNNHVISCAEWLDTYFAHQNLPEVTLDLSGTPFQLKVWKEISRIKMAETITYNNIAEKIPGTSPRAVGNATGANPVSLIIPCHRVIGTDGKLHGYGGGIKRKVWLLAFEKGDSLFLPDV